MENDTQRAIATLDNHLRDLRFRFDEAVKNIDARVNSHYATFDARLSELEARQTWATEYATVVQLISDARAAWNIIQTNPLLTHGDPTSRALTAALDELHDMFADEG
jgi:hypothetical protein